MANFTENIVDADKMRENKQDFYSVLMNMTKEIRDKALDCGYNTCEIWWVKEKGSSYRNLHFDLRSDDRFHPSIIPNYALNMFDRPVCFEMSTISVGALDRQDAHKYLAAVSAAYHLLSYLEEYDLDKLPTLLYTSLNK